MAVEALIIPKSKKTVNTTLQPPAQQLPCVFKATKPLVFSVHNASYPSTMPYLDSRQLASHLIGDMLHQSIHHSRRFDVCEKNDTYEIFGELPGIHKDQINIEWSDSNVLTISGRIERNLEHEKHSNFNKATVEDEQPAEEIVKKAEKPADAAKWIIRERYFGDFSRSFAFDKRVDQENVNAGLKDGILSVIIPKMQAAKNKIEIKVD